jgi:WD40 repeat protein
MDSELWSFFNDQSSIFHILPLRGESLVRAIEAPARALGVYFEPRLSDRLVADAASEPGALPLLQVALMDLWYKRRSNYLCQHDYLAAPTPAADFDSGSARIRYRTGLALSLEHHANAVFDQLTSEDERTIARRIFLRLVNFAEGRQPTRRQQTVSALATTGREPQGFAKVLDVLTRGRLLTRDQRKDSGTLVDVVDLAHEALIAGWSRLDAWIGNRWVDEQKRRAWESKVQEWIARDRKASLLDAVELAEAEVWLNSDAALEVGPPAELQALMDESRRAKDQAQRERQLRKAEQYVQHGQELLLAGHPMRALPFFVAARESGIESTSLKIVFATVAVQVPRLVTGHADDVVHAQFSPDSARLLTASNDATVRLWDANTGDPLTPALRHTRSVVAASFNFDGTRIVTASDDKTARVWDGATGAPLTAPIPHVGNVVAASFSPDGTRIVTATNDACGRVWDATNGEPRTPPLQYKGLGAFEHRGRFAVFSEDGARVLIGGFNATPCIWDASTGEPAVSESNLFFLGPYYGDKGRDEVTVTSFTCNGTRALVATGYDGARIVDTVTLRPIASLADNHVVGAWFSQDGVWVVTAHEDRTAWVRRAEDLKGTAPPLPHPARVCAASLSRDAARVVTVDSQNVARVWDGKTGDLLRTFDANDTIRTAIFSADAARVVTAGSSVRIWEVSPPDLLPSALELDGRILAHWLAPHSARIVTATGGGMACILDATTGDPLTPPLVHPHSPHDLRASFASDGMHVATASHDGVRVWSAVTGAPLTPPLEHADSPRTPSFSVDGSRLLTVGQSAARVWDVLTGRALTPALRPSSGIRSASFSPSGALVLTASYDSVCVWSATTGQPITEELWHSRLDTAVFGRDSKTVITYGKGTACVWDAMSGQLLGSGPVSRAWLSPDGGRALASIDGASGHEWRVWDVATGKPLTPPFESDVDDASFSPDGTCVAIARAGTVCVSDTTTGKTLVRLSALKGVRVVAFSAGGLIFVTGDRCVEWISLEAASIDKWREIAVRCPYTLADDILVPNQQVVDSSGPGRLALVPVQGEAWDALGCPYP